MAWLSAVSADNTIIVKSTTWVERHIYTAETRERTNSEVTTHYVGLTKAAADTQQATSAAISGCIEAYVERVDDAAQYRVVQTVVTYGEWAAV